MTDPRLAATHPGLANALEELDVDLGAAISQVVEHALEANGLVVPDRSLGAVRSQFVALDEAACDIERREGNGDAYLVAFQRARALNALLEVLEGRPDAAIYDVLYALGGDERYLFALLGRLR